MDNTPENVSKNQEIKDIKFSFKKKSLFKKIFALALSPILFLSFLYYFFLSTPQSFTIGTVVNIEEGSSLRDISLSLKDKHIIRSKVAFETFVIIYGGEKHIAYGDYLFESGIPVFEIARRIAIKDRHLAPIKITIPEGFDIMQIANTFSGRLPLFNKDKFLNISKNKDGYLFPDTYFFFSNANEEDVVKYLGDNFNKKIKTILAEVDFSGKTEKDVIIMASIIEREAKGDADRGYVSGILWNRIKKGMPLQVDAAPNTYKTKGLPEKPICNPGLEAIKVAIHPIVSNYLYYLHDKNGQIHYAKTFDEHKKNKFKYLK